MLLPSLDNIELNILKQLYKFSYLNTNQVYQLNPQVTPRTIQRHLKQLTETNYLIAHDFNRNDTRFNTKPTIYSLSKLARKRLKSEKECDIHVLNRVYQQKRVSKQVIYQHVFLATMYLHLKNQLIDGETLHFSTKAQLQEFDYFPKPLPEAYIAVTDEQKKVHRYFLFLFTTYVPMRFMKSRIEQNIYYSENVTWTEATNQEMPVFLIVCVNKNLEKQITQVISSTLPRKTFYTTTRDEVIKAGFKGDIWEIVT